MYRLIGHILLWGNLGCVALDVFNATYNHYSLSWVMVPVNLIATKIVAKGLDLERQ